MREVQKFAKGNMSSSWLGQGNRLNADCEKSYVFAPADRLMGWLSVTKVAMPSSGLISVRNQLFLGPLHACMHAMHLIILTVSGGENGLFPNTNKFIRSP